MNKRHSQIALAILTVGLLACEGSITSVDDSDPGFEALASAGLELGAGDCVVPGVDLISWWAGDGDFTDRVGSNPVATMAGVSFVAGVDDQAFRFPGSNSQLEVNDSGTLRPAVFTVDFWAERLGPGQNGDNTYGNMLVQKALDDSSLGGSLFSYFVSWRADGHIAASVYFDNDPGGAGAPVRIVSTDAFPDNAPIFVALSVDGPANGHGVTLYVDGDVQGMFDATGLGSVNYGVGSMVVGANYSAARNVGFPRSFDGVVDEVQIFSSALSQADVQAIQSGGTCKETGPTVFDFDVTIDQATVRFDAQGRSDMDAFDVDGVLPLDLLAGFEPGTDEVTVGFAAYEQTLSADSFVRKDDKWALNLSPTAEGVWRVDLHDDGRFKLQANGPFGAEFGAVDFSQPVELFVSWGPYTGEATIQLDEQLHFRAH